MTAAPAPIVETPAQLELRAWFNQRFAPAGQPYTAKEFRRDALLSEMTALMIVSFESDAEHEKRFAALEKRLAEADEKAIGFVNFELVDTGERLLLRARSGSAVNDIELPVVVDRGAWAVGKTYAPGAGVTCGGRFWIARRETTARPEMGCDDWRLAVNKGRDGKDGRP